MKLTDHRLNYVDSFDNFALLMVKTDIAGLSIRVDILYQYAIGFKFLPMAIL